MLNFGTLLFPGVAGDSLGHIWWGVHLITPWFWWSFFVFFFWGGGVGLGQQKGLEKMKRCEDGHCAQKAKWCGKNPAKHFSHFSCWYSYYPTIWGNFSTSVLTGGHGDTASPSKLACAPCFPEDFTRGFLCKIYTNYHHTYQICSWLYNICQKLSHDLQSQDLLELFWTLDFLGITFQTSHKSWLGGTRDTFLLSLHDHWCQP